MRKIFQTFLVLVCVGITSQALAVFHCGYEEDLTEKVYPYEEVDQITAKLIFVSFSNTTIPLSDSLHGEALRLVGQYIEDHSHGKLSLSPESEVLLPYGQSFGQGASSWTAQLAPGGYSDTPPGSYLDDWEEEIGDWKTDKSYSYLMAEILWKIRASYINQPSPFGEYETDEIVDQLFVVLLTRDSPFGGVIDGLPRVEVNAEGLQVDPFFQNLRTNLNVLSGSMQIFCNYVDPLIHPTHTDIISHEVAYIVLHEFLHTIGPGDGPPNLNTVFPDAAKYYYGNLNLMCQHSPGMQGIPPIGLPWLPQVPWIDVIDLTGENHDQYVLYDIRFAKPGVDPADPLRPRGKILKFRRETGRENEYFLFAYHSGMGIDAVEQYDNPGSPLVPSVGLEAWHCVGTHMFDLESAFGLYSGIDTPALPSFSGICPGGVEASWGVFADTELGYDNYDNWELDSTAGQYRSNADYDSYLGDQFDFFRTDYAQTGDCWAKNEFSWRTNPSTRWYSTDPTPSHPSLVRRNSQDEGNSLYVKILSEERDYDPSAGIYPHAVLHLASSPYETINIPYEGFHHSNSGQGPIFPVNWTRTPDFVDVIDEVDILYYPTSNNDLFTVIASGVPVAPTTDTYAWSLTPDDGTEGGRISVRFHNTESSSIAEEFSGTFTIAGRPKIVERMVWPSERDRLFEGSEYLLKWSAAFADESVYTINSITVQFSSDDGNTWTNVTPPLQRDSIPGGSGYYLDPDENVFAYPITPEKEWVCENGRFRLILDSTYQGTTSSATGDASDAIPIFPVYGKFEETTNSVFSGGEFIGKPYSIVPVTVGADSGVLVGISKAKDPDNEASGKYYRNSSSSTGLEFLDQTGIYLPEDLMPVGTVGLVVADYDRDGRDDIFACEQSSEFEALLLRNSGAGFEDDSARAFFRIPSALLESSLCASWIDYDHDGDLDLFVGRGELVDSGMGDPARGGTPLRDCLFEQDKATATFSEVAVNVGLANETNFGVTTSVAWSDFDGDGYWDVAVGDQHETGNQTTLYRQNQDGRFYPDTSFSVPGPGVSSVFWSDMDKSGTLDLVTISAADGGSFIYFNQGSQLAAPISLDGFSPLSFSDCKAFDYNLDGWTDLLLTNRSGRQVPVLLANLMGDSRHSVEFVDIGDVAIPNPGSEDIHGIYVDDFDADGDFELFLGREDCATGTLFAGECIPGQGPVQWVDLKLHSYSTTHPFGTTVSLFLESTGEPLGVQVLDGGSGRGGQSPQRLRFGLGSISSAIKVKVKWSLGFVSTHIIQPSEFSSPSSQTIVFLNEYMGCATCLDESSVDWEMLVGPGGQIEWRFTWNTDYWTDPSLDAVSFQPVANCGDLAGAILQPGITPGVTGNVNYVFDKINDEVHFEHTVNYTGVSCYPNCSISYTVQSSDGQWIGSSTSSPKTSKMPKLCPMSN